MQMLGMANLQLYMFPCPPHVIVSNKKSDLEERIASFTPPAGFKIDTIPMKTKRRSVIYDYGVRVSGLGSKKGQSRRHRLASSTCKANILVK